MVGSNDSQTKFRVLKIDRTEPKELIISDDKIVYSEREIRDLLTMIDVGNRSKVGQKMGSGFNKTISSYGMIGFVRFLEGNSDQDCSDVVGEQKSWSGRDRI